MTPEHQRKIVSPIIKFTTKCKFCFNLESITPIIFFYNYTMFSLRARFRRVKSLQRAM